MDKKAFFVLLAEKLLDRNLEEDQILKQIRHFDRYFSRFTEEEISEEIKSLGDLDILADNIINLLNEKKSNDSEVIKNELSETRPVEEEFKEAEEITDEKSHIKNDSNDFSEEDESTDTKVIDAIDSSESDINNDTFEKSENDSEAPDNSDTIRMDAIKITNEIEKDYDQLHMIIEAHSNTRETIIPDAISDNKILGMNNKTLFWVVLIVTLPISVAMLGLFFGLFALGFILLAAVTCIFFILLAGTAAGGTGLFLFGVIYGAGQTAVSIPIGVYEIGFAVIIAGIAILLGVLFYNAAMVLMPCILRKFYHFFISTVKSGWKSFIRIKRECEQS